MVPSAFQASRVTIVAMERMMITVVHVEERVWLQKQSVIYSLHAIFAACRRTRTIKKLDRTNAARLMMSSHSLNHILWFKVLIVGVQLYQALLLSPLRLGSFLPDYLEIKEKES